MRTSIFNKNVWFFQLVVVACLVCVWGCIKKNDLDNGQRCNVEAKIGQDDDIVGKWKLVKGRTVSHEPRTMDFSCDNVIYDFQEDGILKVSSDTENLISIGPGEYQYELRLEPFVASTSEEFTLQINGLVMGSEISSDAMILNNSYLDGPVLHFVRIK